MHHQVTATVGAHAASASAAPECGEATAGVDTSNLFVKAREVIPAGQDLDLCWGRDEFTHHVLRLVQDGFVLRCPRRGEPGGWLVTVCGDAYRATELTRMALSLLTSAGLLEWEAYSAAWALRGTERALLTARGRRLLWRFDGELGLIPRPRGGDPAVDGDSARPAGVVG